MKKIYLFLFSTIGISQMNAQLTLTKAANEPVIGDTYDNKVLDTNSTALPMNIMGSNVTWNINNITETGAINTNTFTAPGTNAANYPGTTIVQDDQGTGNTTFFKSTASSFELLGATVNAGGYAAELNYNSNSAVLVNYPVSMGYTSSDLASGIITVASLNGTFNSTVQTTADGTGTLNFNSLASASYSNCLRVKTSQHVAFTITYMSFPITGTLDQTIYNYYVSGTKEPIFTVNYNHIVSANPLSPIDQSQNDVTALSNITVVGLKENKLNDLIFKAYPNPAQNEVNIHFVLTQTESYTIEIVNTLGQVVKTIAKPNLQPGMYNETLDVSGLTSGVYHINVSGKNARGVEKLIIQ